MGEVKSLPMRLARCLPPPAVLWLLCTGMVVPALSISEGAGCPWEGAGGAPVPISPCTQAGKCRQGPGVAGDVLLRDPWGEDFSHSTLGCAGQVEAGW